MREAFQGQMLRLKRTIRNAWKNARRSHMLEKAYKDTDG
jgi:hypothetical protein